MVFNPGVKPNTAVVWTPRNSSHIDYEGIADHRSLCISGQSPLLNISATVILGKTCRYSASAVHSSPRYHWHTASFRAATVMDVRHPKGGNGCEKCF